MSTVTNPTDHAVEVMLVSWFTDDPDQQFARRVWIPPHATRRATQPIITAMISEEARAKSKERSPTSRALISGMLKTVLVDADGGREYGRGDSSLIILDHEWRAAVLRGDGYMDKSSELARINASNLSESGHADGRRLPTLVQEGREPDYYAGWDQYKLVLVTREQPQLSSTQVQALRQYLINGGVVWITLDTVDPSFCERLLGDSFTCRIIDRVQYNDLTFTDSRGSQTTASLEQPVNMMRIVAPGFNVEHTVDGWPASVWRDVGQGRLIVTTAGSRAWLEQPADIASGHLLDIDQLAFLYEQPITVTAEQQAQMARSHIGYEIMGRSRVVTVLAALVGALLLSGIVLTRFRRLEWQSLVSAGLAITATLVLLGMGSAHGKMIPSTIAGTQWFRVYPTQDTATVSTTRTVYAQSTASVSFAASAGGVGEPAIEDGKRRMVWSDVDRWHWEAPELYSQSVRTFESQNIMALDEPIAATFRFGEQKLTGEIMPGQLTGLGDPIIATRSGRLVPRLIDGGFEVEARQRATSDQFFTGSVALSDEQARRLEVYRSLLNRTVTKLSDYYPKHPTLLVWADAINDGTQVELQGERRESALVEIPLRFEPVEPGTKVHVPAALIERHADRGPRGDIRVTPYDPRRNEWIGQRNSDMIFMFRFELPQVVSHMEMTHGILRVQIDAPQRPVNLLDPALIEHKALDTRVGPQGTLEIDLAQWPVFQPDENGHIRIRMGIGDAIGSSAESNGGGPTAYWGISGMSLEVDGVVLEPQTQSE